MTKVKIKGVAIVKEPTISAFMQAADVFEKHKVAIKMVDICYTMEEELQSENDEDLIPIPILGHKAMLNEFMPNLVFGYIKEVEVNNTVLENRTMPPYVDSNISIISNGLKCGLLVDFVKQFKELEYEEGDLRKIKSIGFAKKA